MPILISLNTDKDDIFWSQFPEDENIFVCTAWVESENLIKVVHSVPITTH